MRKTSDQPPTNREERRAIATSLVFLILGLAVVIFAKSVAGIEGDAVIVFLLLVPVLVYVIISGRLKELKGPGGWEARFAEVAAQSVSSAAQPVEPSEEIQVVAKEGLRGLHARGQELDEVLPIVLKIILGKIPGYDWSVMQRYLEFLSQYRNFKLVVFVNTDDRFVAYMPAWAFRRLFALPELGDEFINVLNQGRLQDLYRFPGVARETISIRSSNAEALREMKEKGLEALVVVDENRKVRGVAEREQVLSSMMLALLK